MSFKENLRAARIEANLSQQGLADRLQISKRTIEKWETGERTPPDHVQRLVLDRLEQNRYETALEDTLALVQEYLGKAKAEEAKQALEDIYDGLMSALKR